MPTEKEKKPDEAASTEKKPLKPCCACPETKQPRDACIMENGEENWNMKDFSLFSHKK